jgi:hypothetical protein
MGQKGAVTAGFNRLTDAGFPTPEDRVLMPAYFLCAAQEISESQILDAAANSWQAALQTFNALR